MNLKILSIEFIISQLGNECNLFFFNRDFFYSKKFADSIKSRTFATANKDGSVAQLDRASPF